MSKVMSGVLELDSKEYNYVLEDRILTILQPCESYFEDFKDLSYIESIHGVSDVSNVVFIGCNRINTVPWEIKYGILGYIILANDYKGSFDRIDFYSKAINGFYSPRNGYIIDTSEGGIAVKGIKIQDREHTRKTYESFIDGERLTIGLDVYQKINLRYEEEEIGRATSILYMSFSELKNPHDVLKCFLYVSDFLSFVNFRKDIPIDKVEIFRKDNDKYVKCGKVYIFQKECDDYKPNAHKTITLSDITDEYFPTIFSQVAEKRLCENHNPFLYPENSKEDRYVDAAKWLITAISFEGEFNLFFPNYKAERDTNFEQAKLLLLNAIEKAVEESGVSINNKKNSALSSFKHLITYADTTIEEKYRICLSEFECETKEAINRIISHCRLPKDINLAKSYAEYRNSTAHGAVRRPEDTEVATYRTLRIFIYVMNLRRANIPADKIKYIIEKMF